MNDYEKERNLSALLDAYKEVKPKLVAYFMHLARQENTAQEVMDEVASTAKGLLTKKVMEKKQNTSEMYKTDLIRVLNGMIQDLIPKIAQEAIAQFGKANITGLPSNKFSSTFHKTSPNVAIKPPVHPANQQNAPQNQPKNPPDNPVGPEEALV